MGTKQRRKNLILITCDALRADFLGSYGFKGNTSPTLDNFAENAVVFEKAYSTGPNTASSFPSLLTGTYPRSYGTFSYGDLLDKSPPIPEILKNNGYRTGAFHSNPYLSQIFGYNRGFDVFSDTLKTGQVGSSSPFYKLFGRKLLGMLHSETFFAPVIRSLNKAIGLLKRFENWFHTLMDFGMSGHLTYTAAPEMTSKGKNFIEKCGKKPFFLWIHYMDPHTPLLPPPRYIKEVGGEDHPRISREESLRLYRKQVSDTYKLTNTEVSRLKKLYASEIKYFDTEMAGFFQYLKNKGLFDKSTIVVTADHGEEFNEHGDLLHKEKLYNELLHVPLIIKDPQVRKKKIREKVSLVDLAPTLLDLLKVPKPIEMEGISLLPLIKNEGKKRSKIFSGVVHTERMQLPSDTLKIAFNNGKWKLIHNKKEKDELYDIKTDPHEKLNLIDEKKAIAKKMLTSLRGHLGEINRIRVNKFSKREIKKRISNLKREKLPPF